MQVRAKRRSGGAERRSGRAEGRSGSAEGLSPRKGPTGGARRPRPAGLRFGPLAPRALLLALLLIAAACAKPGPGEPPESDPARPTSTPPTAASGPVPATGPGAPSEGSPPADGTRSAERRAEAPVLEEVRGPIVDRIHWTGVTILEQDALEERIVTSARPRLELRFWRDPPRLDAYALEEDLERIVDVYHEHGYFGAQAEAVVRPTGEREPIPSIDLPDTEAARVVVEFVVVEGEPTRLLAWQLEIEAAPDDPSPPDAAERARLREQVAVETPSDFGTRLYRERRRALLAECGVQGFPFARISGGAQVDPETRQARVDWTLHLGRRAFVRSIRIEGLERVAPEIVRRELAIAEGERFSLPDLVESERRLVATGLFGSAVIGRPRASDEPEGDAGALDLVVHLEEAPPRSLRASVGYGAEDGPRGEIALDWRNFLGNARRLNLRAFGSLLDVGFEGSLGQPYLFGPRTRGDLTVSALRQSRPGYEAFVTGASGLVTFRPDRESPWSFTLGPGYELAEIIDFGVEIGPEVRGPKDATIVNGFGIVRYEDVDDLLDPTRGLRVELASELGGYPIGSDLDYHQWSLELRAYRSLGPLVLAARAAATTLDPIGAVRGDVPLTRRLYSGGTNSVRGFGFQKLGPEDANNDPIGGLSRMELGTELRLPVWRAFSLVGFVDAGDVRSTPWRWRPGELRASAGPGLRVATPVGPLRFDVGFLLNPPPDADPWRFHLSVGHAY